MEPKILLKDILNFDELRKVHPQKTIKLRFNTSWADKNDQGETLYRDYLQMYMSEKQEDKKFLEENIMSSHKRLSEADIVFQFININQSQNKWLLIDAMNITKKSKDVMGVNPFNGVKFEIAQGERLKQYDPYYGRIIVKKPKLGQNFFYSRKDIVDNVELTELLPKPYLKLQRTFPGYENIVHMYADLKSSIYSPEWQTALECVYGVYILTDVKTGEQYIGSATGSGGIFGRWRTYLESGFKDDSEYPNVRLQELIQRKKIKYIEDNFQFSILEIFNKNEEGRRNALRREIHWKKVFRTRDYGYNAN